MRLTILVDVDDEQGVRAARVLAEEAVAAGAIPETALQGWATGVVEQLIERAATPARKTKSKKS